MFAVLAQVMLGIGEIAVRSKNNLQKRSEFIGIEHIKQAKEQGKNVILLVPHGWAIDASGIILHTHGIPMTSMYNPHRNPLVDWLWTLARERFGGKNACPPKWHQTVFSAYSSGSDGLLFTG